VIGPPDDNEHLVLLLSKELFRRGDAATREGSRFSHGIAVSHFHDAAETCARAAALKIRTPVKPEATFLEYWVKTNDWAEKQQLSVRLGRHAEMGDLNEARKYFKHRGKLTQPEYVVGYRATTHAFLVDTFRDFFLKDFDSISSVTFLRELRVRTKLEEAQNALAASDIKAALERCADAWAVTSRQQKAFFPDRTFSTDVPAILQVRAEFATVYDHLYQLARLAFAGLLGLNAGDILLLIQTLPVRQGDGYVYQTRPESVSPKTVAHMIELIADYSTALLRQVDGLTRQAWSEGIIDSPDDPDSSEQL
jgi:hypothetical protein